MIVELHLVSGSESKGVCMSCTLTSNRAVMVKLDREDSRVCLVRKEMKDQEDSQVYPDPLDCRYSQNLRKSETFISIF